MKRQKSSWHTSIEKEKFSVKLEAFKKQARDVVQLRAEKVSVDILEKSANQHSNDPPFIAVDVAMDESSCCWC